MISKSSQGKNNPMYGKKREDHPAYGTKRSFGMCKKMSEVRKMLSKNQVIKIKQMLLNKIPQRTIAKKFHISPYPIYCINIGKHYAEIQLPGAQI